jgi:putative endonuclease
MYFVYMLECKDGSLYTGITTDVERRFAEHQAGTASHYTHAHGAVKMVYTEACADRSTASKRENAIKRLTREQKLLLIG